MSTTTLLDMRSAIVEVLKRELKGVKEVREHGGRFTIEELKAYGASAPCVAVACMGVPDAADYGTDVRSRALWVAMVVTKDEGPSKRDTIVLAVVHQLLMLIARQKWATPGPDGTTKTHGAKNAARVQAANLYSRQADQAGIALWAVTWEQDAFLEPLAEDVLVDFNTFIARYDVAPRNGVFDPTNEDQDTVTMEQS